MTHTTAAMAVSSEITIATQLRALAADVDNQEFIAREATCMSGLFSLLASDDVRVLTLVADAYQFLSSNPKNRHLMSVTPGLLAAMVDLTEHADPVIADAATQTLANLQTVVNAGGGARHQYQQQYVYAQQQQQKQQGLALTKQQSSAASKNNNSKQQQQLYTQSGRRAFTPRYLRHLPIIVHGLRHDDMATMCQIEKTLVCVRGVVSVTFQPSAQHENAGAQPQQRCVVYTAVDSAVITPLICEAVARHTSLTASGVDEEEDDDIVMGAPTKQTMAGGGDADVNNQENSGSGAANIDTTSAAATTSKTDSKSSNNTSNTDNGSNSTGALLGMSSGGGVAAMSLSALTQRPLSLPSLSLPSASTSSAASSASAATPADPYSTNAKLHSATSKKNNNSNSNSNINNSGSGGGGAPKVRGAIALYTGVGQYTLEGRLAQERRRQRQQQQQQQGNDQSMVGSMLSAVTNFFW